MNCCAPCKFILLILLNILCIPLLIVGLLLTIGGALVLGSAGVVAEWVRPWLDQVIATANSATGTTLNTSSFSVVDLAGALAAVALAIGLILVAIAIFGILASCLQSCFECCKSSIPMIIFAVITGIVTLAMMILVYLASGETNVFTDALKTELKPKLVAGYTGIDGTDPTTLMWNTFMIGLQCCGIDDYRDFAGSPWDTASSLFTPIACCKNTETISGATPTCAMTPTVLNSNYLTGCYDKVWSFVLGDAVTFKIVAWSIIGVPGALFAIALVYVLMDKCCDHKVGPI